MSCGKRPSHGTTCRCHSGAIVGREIVRLWTCSTALRSSTMVRGRTTGEPRPPPLSADRGPALSHAFTSVYGARCGRSLSAASPAHRARSRPRPPAGVRVPGSISNGTRLLLERVPYITPAHVMNARVCGVSRRSFTVAGSWSSACSRSAATTLQLVGRQGDPRAPMWLKHGGPKAFGRVVDAATRRGVGRCRKLHPMHVSRLTSVGAVWKS